MNFSNFPSCTLVVFFCPPIEVTDQGCREEVNISKFGATGHLGKKSKYKNLPLALFFLFLFLKFLVFTSQVTLSFLKGSWQSYYFKYRSQVWTTMQWKLQLLEMSVLNHLPRTWSESGSGPRAQSSQNRQHQVDELRCGTGPQNPLLLCPETNKLC